MRRTVDIFGVSLPIAIISAIMLLFAYLDYMTPFILLLAIGAIFKITDTVLATNTMKISLLYVFHLIFGVCFDLFVRAFNGFFNWILELVEDDTVSWEALMTGRSTDSGLGTFIGVMNDIFDVIGYVEVVFFFVLLLVGALSLLRSDAIKLPLADGVFNKLLSKGNNNQNVNNQQ